MANILSLPHNDNELGPKIYKIVYRSQLIDVPDMPQREREVADIREREVADIMRVSIDWNYKNGINGALLLSSDGYAQVLEGPSRAIKSLFGHISCDLRHRNIELLYNEYDTKRDVENWAMAVVAPPGEEDVELASTTNKRKIVLSEGAEDIRMMLRWLLIDEPLRGTAR